MTKFNPENKETLTYGECLKPAMEITDPEDAKQYKLRYIEYIAKHLKDGVSESGLTAYDIANQNLGYYAGYYSDDVRRRVEKLFNCKHPIFGSIEENGAPSMEQAFNLGKQHGESYEKRISN